MLKRRSKITSRDVIFKPRPHNQNYLPSNCLQSLATSKKSSCICFQMCRSNLQVERKEQREHLITKSGSDLELQSSYDALRVCEIQQNLLRTVYTQMLQLRQRSQILLTIPSSFFISMFHQQSDQAYCCPRLRCHQAYLSENEKTKLLYDKSFLIKMLSFIARIDTSA